MNKTSIYFKQLNYTYFVSQFHVSLTLLSQIYLIIRLLPFSLDDDEGDVID